MNNRLQQFNFNESSVRVVQRDGQPWFVAADVCEVLSLSNPSMALNALDDDEKGTLRISEGTSVKGGNPNMGIVSESGLYALIFKSRKPQAKLFRKWVTSEVLPAIRKTGSYAVSAPTTPEMHPVAVQFLNFFDSLHKRGVPVDQCSKTAGQVFQSGVQGFEFSQAALLPGTRALAPINQIHQA
ncbi:Bro-N domain-containing protein [Verrucomicrobium sp. BvORR106]|uniref:BRO-N domain-containing protein n=1 Tax=Verrucomicrobium sp. BvORR106 TaxID=1403819 RepID=UPI00068C1F74|nr:Bro-N domain-containing protein [Verrucomicrobium sp. BvORR106]